jgi:bifunctional pyridoxal-dependent enzyme with beta-cystathionase and maltose regulon repressor activities
LLENKYVKGMSGMKNRKFFDEITDRTGTHSIKWDRVKEGGLAMWVADMDFRTGGN